MAKSHVPKPDYLDLTAVGLTKVQAHCYALLCNGYSLSVGDLAKRLAVSRTNLYILLRDLQKKGFVTSVRIIGPAKYTAVPLARAMVTYADYQRHRVKDLIVLQQHVRRD